MAGGLARQLGFCGLDISVSVDINPAPEPKPRWCSNSAFVQRLIDTQTRLWNSVKGGVNGTLKTSILLLNKLKNPENPNFPRSLKKEPPHIP